jgi:hypothetical protein
MMNVFMTSVSSLVNGHGDFKWALTDGILLPAGTQLEDHEDTSPDPSSLLDPSLDLSCNGSDERPIECSCLVEVNHCVRACLSRETALVASYVSPL